MNSNFFQGRRVEITVGIDILDIKRLEKVIERYKEKFIKRIYTTKEIEHIPAQNRSYYMAVSFSFKEAIWKSLPDAQQKEFSFKDISIIWDNGTPYPVLKDRAGDCGLTLNFFVKGKNIITTAIFSPQR
jgi:phosphopantetheine--protein transferase-like protein